MSGRTTIQLGVLAVMLGSGIYLLDEHLDRRQTVRVLVRRVFDVALEPVTAIGFERDGRLVEFVRKGELWFLQSPMRARANTPLVERMVSELEKLHRQDQISKAHRKERGLTMADYGLIPARTKIMLETGGGRVETLVLGDMTPFGGAVYARVERNNEVFTLPDSVLTLFPDDLPALRDRMVVSGSPVKTERIDLYRRDAGFVQLVRQKSGWMLQQPLVARADEAAVQRLLEAVYAMRVTTFLWDAEPTEAADGETAARVEMAQRGQIEAGGLAADAARLRLMVWTEEDRLGQEIFVGRSAGAGGDSDVYVRKGGVDAVYTVPASILDACAVSVDALRDRAIFHYAAGDVGYVRLQYGENRVELQRQPVGAATGGGWRLQTPLRAPADAEIVNALVARLLGLRVATYLPAVADDPVDAAMDAPLLTLTLSSTAPTAPTGAEGEKTARETTVPAVELVLAGRATGLTERLAKTAVDKEWFTLSDEAVKGLDETLASPLFFRDRLMLSVNTETVFRIQQVTVAGTNRVERDLGTLPSEWRCREFEGDSRPVSKAAVADLLAAAARLEAGRFVAFMPPDLSVFGLDIPVAVVSFGFRDTETIQNTLLLGSAVDNAWRYAMIQGSDFVFTLAAPVADRLLQPLSLPLTTESAPVGSQNVKTTEENRSVAGEK